ncbi:enoyl-CoA hydratase/isomerase family protein [Virgisporangium ochraceum]
MSTTENDPGVQLHRDGPVATISLSRPEVLNAQTPQMWDALRRFGKELSGDVRVVVVRGEGRSFSAGIDLKVAGDGEFHLLASSADEVALARIEGYQEAFTWLRRPDLVSIAAVHGHAIGAGFQLALACDLRVVADDAKFSMAEISLGLVPDLGGTKPLYDLVGPARALELCVTGRRVGAVDAERMGLVNRLVPAAELDAAVADLAAAIVAGNRDAVVETKALVAGAGGRDLDTQRRYEREAQLRRLRDLAGLGE